MKKPILALSFLIIAISANAQTVSTTPADYPLISKERLSFGVRAEYNWWQDNSGATTIFPFKKEFGLGIPVSYALTAKRYPDGHVGPPTLALTGRAIYFVDSRITSYAIGLNLGIYDGGH